ncbi:hypothetical protein AGDE_14734 [Angomonas deanei]|nr:hypothetical protein AGDE_14734 [Angomonas deanei]|eukprot:EPY20334.1 hypothetical protein AGDE_14734 [Angomonas deanei]
MKGLKEQDAKRALERKLGIKHMGGAPSTAAKEAPSGEGDEVKKVVSSLRKVETNATEPPAAAKDNETDEVKKVVSGLRHVQTNKEETSEIKDSADEVKQAVKALRHVDPTDMGGEPIKKEPINESDRPKAAKLTATTTREAMDKIVTEEIREWVAIMVGSNYNTAVLQEENFCDAIRDGIVLNVLLQKMRNPPVPDEALKVPKKATGFFMRDNVNNFLIEAKKEYNLKDAQVFIESDLCDKKNERQVITCLMSIARLAYNRGDIPLAPSIIMYEKEIDTNASKLNDEELGKLVEEAEKADEEVEEVEEVEEEVAGDAAAPGDTSFTSCVSGASSHEEPKEATPVEQDAKKEEEEKKPNTPQKPEPTEAEKKSAEEKGVFYLRDGQLGVKVDGEIKKRPVMIRKRMPRNLEESAAPQYYSKHWDGVDVAVGVCVNEHYKKYPESRLRLRGIASTAGEYVLYSRGSTTRRQLYIRILQRQPFVRKSQGPGGPSWVSLEEILEEAETQN